jgi:hypothetical protein
VTVRNWTGAAGNGLWSDPLNWSLSAPPTDGSKDVISFASGNYTSVIDAGFLAGTTSPVFSDINLQAAGVTLDVQRSITVAEIDGDLSANGTANLNGLLEIGNGAVVTYNVGSLVNTTNGNAGAGFYVKGDGVGAIGTLLINGDINTGGTVIADHVNIDVTGGIADTTAVLTLKNNATWTAQSSETFNVGTVNLAGGGIANFGALPTGALTFEGFVAADQQVVMSNGNNELVLPNTSDARELTVTGFDRTDKIEIAGLTSVKSATYDASRHLNLYSGMNGTGTLLDTLTGITLAPDLSSTLTPGNFLIGTDATGTFIEVVSCFTPGTRILTARGEVKVEELRAGDIVLTKQDAGMEPRPILWIGHRKLDLTRHPYPWMGAPIRVRRGAIADNVPQRDLLISPDHGIFINGGLVPARLLVNGTTIAREWCDTVEYYHIECAAHAIILAEGLTVETYLDTGNRMMFDNADTALLLHPQFDADYTVKSWDDACAPLLIEADVVEPIWRLLQERSVSLGWRSADARPMTEDADVRLLANGRQLAPTRVRNGRHVFILPHDVAEVALLSRTACPTMQRPWVEDQRQLGVAVCDIVFRGDGDAGNGDYLALSAADPSIMRGWWPAEHDDATTWRWTNGAGVIPLPFPTRVIEIRIAITTKYPVEPSAWLGAVAA